MLCENLISNCMSEFITTTRVKSSLQLTNEHVNVQLMTSAQPEILSQGLHGLHCLTTYHFLITQGQELFVPKMTFLPDDRAQSNNTNDFFAVQENIHEYGTLSLQKGIAQWATGK